VDNILSQEEVDALLTAVGRGELDAGSDAALPAAPPNVARYNFRKPNRVSKEQLRMLQSIHETFGRLYAASLTTLLRGMVEIEFRSVEQATYGEFTGALSSPICLAVYKMDPLSGGAVLDVDANLLFVLIERLLGGTGLLPVRVREFTEIERALVEHIAGRAMADLGQAWHHVGAFGFRVDRTETNAEFIQLTSANEVVVVVGFEIKVGDVGGPMTLVYPHVLLEPVMSKLNSHRSVVTAPRTISPEDGAALTESLLHVGVNVRAVLAELSLSVRDVLAMKPGDILYANRPADGPAVVEVEGVPRFTASPGIANRHKALRLLGAIEKGGVLRDSTLGSSHARILPA